MVRKNQTAKVVEGRKVAGTSWGKVIIFTD
jgi:hypothetical protein